MKNLIFIITVLVSFKSVAQVSSVTGTANQIITSGSTGAVTLSLPQNIGTTGTPFFGKIGIGGGGPAGAFGFYNTALISGSVGAGGNLTTATVQSTVTSLATGYQTLLSTVPVSFNLATLAHYLANQGTIGTGSTVASQAGFFAGSTLTGATNNYGFRGDISAATGRWNIFMGGSAQNYLGGKLGIGITVPTEMLDVVGNGKFSGNLYLGTSTTAGVNFYNSRPIGGATTAYGNVTRAEIQSNSTAVAYGYRSWLSTQAAAFNIGAIAHYSAGMQIIGAGSTMSNLYGYLAEATLVGATGINAGFRGQVPAASNRWNLYMDGTASNYLAGNLGIGTTNPTEKLSVNGNIRAKEIRVEALPWPDYVFHKSYSLQPLSELEKFIATNQHLPGIPSASEVEKEGLNLGEMNAILLKKIEELTLYLIEQQKQKQQQDVRITTLEKALLAGGRE